MSHSPFSSKLKRPDHLRPLDFMADLARTALIMTFQDNSPSRRQAA
ncbi:hypothetical protein OCAR_5964 [Afipia carboxidovorans OM5]|nr:hypothetical protein OCAR_5964 [Afipia carboxidovorans OM5]